MPDEQRWLVPNYYPRFACKQGACRTPCCEGWPITLSMQDYFRLVGVSCSPELRRDLDVSLHLCSHPTPDAYAQLSPRWDGQCAMHLPDGRCLLHAELGEDLLPAVCRLYPRGARSNRECSCANSCEAVLELLLDRPEPLQFVPVALNMAVPPHSVSDRPGHEADIRLWLISHMQHRTLPLPRRLLLLGAKLHALEQALASQSDDRLTSLLSGCENLPVSDSPAASQELIAAGLHAASQLLAAACEHSSALQDFHAAAQPFCSAAPDAFARYQQARGRFAALLPEWEFWFEHMLVNHMFFVQFPFEDHTACLADEHLVLCAAYALMRLLCVSQAMAHPGVSSAVDACAAVFRTIEHGSFRFYTLPILRSLDLTDMELTCALTVI